MKRLKQIQRKLYRFENNFTVYGSWDNPYFVTKDIEQWLGYMDIHSVLKDFVSEDEIIKSIVYYKGAYRQVLLVSEFGLYEILMRSNKPKAKMFKAEVKQLLKTIRLKGGVVVPGREEEFVFSRFTSLSDDTKRAMVEEIKRINKNVFLIGGP